MPSTNKLLSGTGHLDRDLVAKQCKITGLKFGLSTYSSVIQLIYELKYILYILNVNRLCIDISALLYFTPVRYSLSQSNLRTGTNHRLKPTAADHEEHELTLI